MSDHLRKIVEEIHKLAQVPPRSKGDKVKAAPATTPATGGGAPAKSTGNVPQRGGGTAKPQGHGGSYISAVGDIKNMQEAMQNFAALATSYGAVKQPSAPPGKTPSQAPKVDSRKKQFNDFITEQYLANADMKGEEFTPDEKRTAKDQKQPTDLVEMNIVLNGLQRIGSPASELKADNAWDFRTNNALKNIYAFAYGLVNIAKDFGRTDAQSFTDDDLAKMKAAIPEDRDPKEIPPPEKAGKAKELTALIKKLTKFYRYYIDNIAMHPGFTRYIAGNEPLMTLQRGGGDPTALNANERGLMQGIDNMKLGHEAIPYITNKPGFEISIPSPQGTNGVIGVGTIPMSALQNVNTLRAFMTSMGIPQNQTSDPRWQRAVINAIMKHVDAVLNLPQAQAKPTPQTTPAQTGSGDLSGAPNTGVRQV